MQLSLSWVKWCENCSFTTCRWSIKIFLLDNDLRWEDWFYCSSNDWDVTTLSDKNNSFDVIWCWHAVSEDSLDRVRQKSLWFCYKKSRSPFFLVLYVKDFFGVFVTIFGNLYTEILPFFFLKKRPKERLTIEQIIDELNIIKDKTWKKNY